MQSKFELIAASSMIVVCKQSKEAFSRCISFAKDSHRDNLQSTSLGIALRNHNRRKVSGNCNNMVTLKSVKEDLQARTLHAVSGLLGKFEYFASLRQNDGSYSHWGLSRVYGEEAAQRALAEAHRNLRIPDPANSLAQLAGGREQSSEPRMVWNSSSFCSN